MATQDAPGLISLFARDDDVSAVSSEEALLRGPEELSAFFQRYALGETTYSWRWDRCEVSSVAAAAWVLAVGIETSTTIEGGRREVPYRMTMVCEQRNGHWLIVHVHGSTPHSGS